MASKADPGKQPSQRVDISSLSAQQVLQVKKQLDDELEHLNTSYTQLSNAQTRFAECIKSVEAGVQSRPEGAPLLVPLTTSLYVPGTLAKKDTVIVDIGTGFYVEKSTADAVTFYNAKIKELATNLKELEGILQGKSTNLRAVEEVLRQKMAQGQQPTGAQGTA